MSEQLDYVIAQIIKSQEDKLNRYLAGNLKTIEEIQFDRGYLKCAQDVLGYQHDYISSKNPQRQEDE